MTDDAARLLPLAVDLARAEVELLDPTAYLAAPTAAFMDAFLHGGRAATFATPVAAYLRHHVPDRDLDAPILHIHMVNRCGSTLLLNALRHHPALVAFNELDPWIGTAVAPPPDTDLAAIDAAMSANIRGFARWCGRRVLLKHRADTLALAEPLAAAFPAGRVLFLVRRPEEVIASQLRRLPRAEPGRSLAELAVVAPTLSRWDRGLPARVLAGFWLDTVARYRALAQGGASGYCAAIRYETLRADPTGALTEIAAFFGLELDPPLLARMAEEFDYDAHHRGEARVFVERPRAELELEPGVAEELAAAWAQPLVGELCR